MFDTAKRNDIAKEILSTERTYVRKLELLARRYLAPCKDKPYCTDVLRNAVAQLDIILGICAHEHMST